MLKSFFVIVVCLAMAQLGMGQATVKVAHKLNKIDSINTATQIKELILKIDKRYSDFKIRQSLEYESRFATINCKKISDSLQVKPWQKADFDNNGLTDILVIGTWSDHHIICILDKGDNYYEIKSITRKSFQHCTFPVVSNNKIKYYFESSPESGKRDKQPTLEQVILTYQFGDFIEDNLIPASHTIEKIEYSTTGCYGSCPIFKLIINLDRTSNWFADLYNKINNKEVKGNFSCTIKAEKYNQIIALLNYIDFAKLKDDYAVGWTDDQSSTLKITYDNGKIKTIKDYGLIGTYGLDRVYQLLFDLRKNQQWTAL